MNATNLKEIVLKQDGFHFVTREVCHCSEDEYYSDEHLSVNGPLDLVVGKKIYRKVKGVGKSTRLEVPTYRGSNTKRFYRKFLSMIAHERPENANAFSVLDEQLGWERDIESEMRLGEEHIGEHDRLVGRIYKIRYYQLIRISQS